MLFFKHSFVDELFTNDLNTKHLSVRQGNFFPYRVGISYKNFRCCYGVEVVFVDKSEIGEQEIITAYPVV